MSMPKKLTLHHQAVQLLFDASTKVVWPARLGTGSDYDLVFPDKERSEHMIRIAEFRNTIRTKYANRLGNEWVVGLATDWQAKPALTGAYEIVDRYKTLEIELEWPAYHALYWLCLWMAHPASPGFVRGGLLDEIVYPIVREVGEWEQLMYDLGLREDEPDAINRGNLTVSTPQKTGSNGSH